MIFDRRKCYNGDMTIKKPMKAPANDGAQVAEMPVSDAPVQAVKTSDGAAATVALCAALAALAMLGAMTFMLWQHLGFLMAN